MNRYYATAGMVLVGLWAAVGSAWAQSPTMPTPPAAAQLTAATTAPADNAGAVKGSNVYVRSGSNLNYYRVLKLNQGDKVTILREDRGWLEILPPPGAFSLVLKNQIDKASDSVGTAKVIAQVYAGSDLEKQTYAKQVKLDKGDKVNIIGEMKGETPEGDFHKVTPPEGATLWIRGDLVNRGGKGKSKIEVVRTGELTRTFPELTAATATRPAGNKPPKKATEAVEPSTPQGDFSQANRDRIRRVENLIAAQTIKPPADQVFEPIVGELRPLAEQSADPVTQAWAKARMEQLQNQMELTAALGEMRALKDKATADANEIARRRAEMKRQMDDWMVNPIVARGEIRVSGLYTGAGGQAKRWRLVDPKTERGIAYIEVPPNSSIDPVQFYGKFVGIEATSYQLQHGTVPPLPIFLVKNIKVMDANAPVDPIIRREAIASPAAPSSQPEGEKPATSQPVLRSSARPEP